jgi:outer membrane lipoprotein carrier protein
VTAAAALLFANPSLAKSTTKAKFKDDYGTLKLVTKRYRKSEMVEMHVEKTVRSDLMGKETRYVGKIMISSGLFRWENDLPEKSLIVFDGTTIWNEQSPPPEFPGNVQVAKARVDKKNKSQILVSSLLGTGSLFENFNILKETKDGDAYSYLVEPKTKDLAIKDLEITVSKPKKEVMEISYKDDVGNVTTMKFSSIEFKNKKNKNLFRYTPPKGAQVTNL